jgi:hypothetical protein
MMTWGRGNEFSIGDFSIFDLSVMGVEKLTIRKVDERFGYRCSGDRGSRPNAICNRLPPFFSRLGCQEQRDRLSIGNPGVWILDR